MSVSAVTGQGVTVEHKGRAFTFAPPDHVKVIGWFGDHLRETTLAEVEKVRVLYGPVAGGEAMSAYLDKAGALVYEFGSLFWFTALQHPKHFHALCLFCLRVHHPDATRAVAEEIAGTPDGGRRLRRLVYGGAADEGETSPGNESAAPASAS